MVNLFVRCLAVATLALTPLVHAADLAVPSASYPTVQSAVNAAVDGDRVLVAAGIYNERVDVQQKAIEIVGAGAALTRFVAQTPGSEIFRLLGPTSAPIALRALAVEGAVHGAVYASTTVSVSNCRFASCRKPARGGALSLELYLNGGATASIVDCEFTGNSTDIAGGAVRTTGGVATLQRCTFTANDVLGSAVVIRGGGAIEVWQGSLVVRDSTFDGNRAITDLQLSAAAGDGGGFSVESRGGSILMDSSNATDSLVIENCTFRNDRAESRITIANSGKAVWQTGAVARGGAVYLSGSAPATLRNVLVEDCLALGTGSGSPDGQSYVICSSFAGAIGLESAAYHTIEDVTIRRCEGKTQLLGGAGTEGHNASGGMLVNNGSLTRVTIEDCKTTRGAGMGGGLHVNVWDWTGTTGTVTATDLTIRRCSSFDGGGAWIRGNSVIIRGTFEDNLATSGAGGGVYGRAGNRVFTDCAFRRNEGRGANSAAGGGFFSDGTAMTIERCVFDANRATCTRLPGGAYAEGGAYYAAFPAGTQVLDSVFQDNSAVTTADGPYGSIARSGAIWSYYPLSIARTNFLRNTARSIGRGSGDYAEGGAIRTFTDSSITLDSCQFLENAAWCQHPTAAQAFGGAIVTNGLLTGADCLFQGNTAGESGSGSGSANSVGGAIFTGNGLLLLRCDFSGNRALTSGFNIGGGGAIRTNAAPYFPMSIESCDFIGNSTNGMGGVLQNYFAFGATPVSSGFAHCTFSGNTAPRANCVASVSPSAPIPLANCSGCGHGPNALAFENIIDAGGNDLRAACVDCNGNGLEDPAEITAGLAADCNANGVPDTCDIAAGLESDGNANGEIDRCEADLDGDGIVGAADLSLLLSSFGLANGSPADFNGDNLVTGSDLAFFLSLWGQ